MRYVLLLFVLAGCQKERELTPQEREAARLLGIAAATERFRKEEAEKKASAERTFNSDARVYAEMFVHKALVQQRGSSLPEHWKEIGEVIKREGNHAMVLVRTGIKEGLFSELVVVQCYVLSIEINGDRYSTTEALRCKDPPSAAQIAVLMIKGKWPSAIAAITPTDTSTPKNKRQPRPAADRADVAPKSKTPEPDGVMEPY